MEKDSLTAMEMCLDNIITYINMKWFKINPIQTQLMYIASWWQIKKCVENLIRVGTYMVERSALTKLMGTCLDEHFSFEHHITQKCKNAMLTIYKIRNLRRFFVI